MNIGSASGNSYSTSASSNKGFSGLVSGLDTDSMVEALLAGAQSKIDKQNALKQQTLWKQEIYRDIIGKINAFKNNYFSATSSNNLMSPTFFNQMSAVTSSSAFTVKATSAAATGVSSLEVLRLASSAKMTGAAVSGKLEGTIDEQALEAAIASGGDLMLDVTLDDNQKTIAIRTAAIKNADGTVNMNSLKNELDYQISKAHGDNQLTVDIANGKLSITTNVGGRKVMVSRSADATGANALTCFGFENGQSNRIGMGGTLAQNYFATPLSGNTFSFSINGEQFTFDKSARMSDIMSAINAGDAGVRITYRTLDDRFIMESTNSGAGFDIDVQDTQGNLMAAMFGNATHVTGQNALVKVDGIETERSSNTFSVNGLNIELKAETTSAQTIEVARNTDAVVEGVKTFIKDYNALIEGLNDLTRSEATYKEYAPLTDVQKKEMSENEIKLWEEKAKQGLLKGDSAVSNFLQSMRTALYEKPEGGLYAIYNIGIETSDEWKDFGKLVMDTDGEARLRQALESHPDDVIKLFTDVEEGLGAKMDKILKDTANTSSASQGTLVVIAGWKNTASDYDNDLYDRLKMIELKIDSLKVSYDKQKQRYWRQFNAMEATISNMNSQSSWLASQLGS